MPSAIIIGGGLAGLAAAVALGSEGFHVEVFEARPFLGGRATSFPLAPAEESSELIDNCQHVLLRCCVNLLDFYQRLGVSDLIHFYREFYFVEPGGRVSTLRRGRLPAPLHFTESFARMRCLGWRDKAAIGRGLMALRRERTRRQDLDRISMLDWLLEKRQTPRAIERFWKQVLVSAVNEDLDRMAARHGFQVFWLGFLARADAYEMGVPAVRLGELYGAEKWQPVGDVTLRLRCAVEQLGPDGIVAAGERRAADYYICALPFERLPALGLPAPPFEHSPITGIHLWFDRAVTDLPHATLLDRTIQWMFNKSEGRYLQLVVSASRGLAGMSRADIVALSASELGEFFPGVRAARLEKAHVIKELRATFSAAPGTEALRPMPETGRPGLFLAGDWTRSGWPATMEGAVRSGYRAAEAVTAASGRPARFLLPDIA
jgi:squalene-associated FAD-dependent desaturase